MKYYWILQCLKQGLSEKFGGPGQIFVSGSLFFPKILASGGGELFFSDIKKGSKKFSGRTLVKLRFKNFFLHKFLLQHRSNNFFRSINIKFWFTKFFPYHYLCKKTFEIIIFYFANLGAPLKLGARGKLPQVPPDSERPCLNTQQDE
jgi:hypothetical protein